jgi:hypothetical protein
MLDAVGPPPARRGLQPSTSQLNLSRFRHCQTDGSQRIPQKVLTLNLKVDECKAPPARCQLMRRDQ